MTITLDLTEDEDLGIEAARDRHNDRRGVNPQTGDRMEPLTSDEFMKHVMKEKANEYDMNNRRQNGVTALEAALPLPKASRDAIVEKVMEEVAKHA